jgi:hypothetical protein
MDTQSAAYRHATEADWAGVDVDECDVFPDGDERPIMTPEIYEANNWDDGREGPKTLDDAKAALLARIADPTAPDDESAAGAYDDLDT